MFGGGHIERFRGVIDDLLRLTDGLGAGDIEIAGPVIIHIGRVDMTFAGRVALADKVGTAAKYVSTGDAVIGFVYSSDIFRYDGIEQAFVCPEDSHRPIVYPGAVSSTSEHAKAAADFLDFCMNDAGAQKIWAKYGFELAE